MNLAPNGKPSNLTPEQYKLVRTKAFKDWFGDWENGIFTDYQKFVEYKHKTGTGRQNLLDFEYIVNKKDLEKAKEIKSIHIKANDFLEAKYQKSIDSNYEIDFDKFIRDYLNIYKTAFELVDTLEKNDDVEIAIKSIEIFNISKFNEWVDYKNRFISKVVDENGEPLVVYHGSKYNFNIFEEKQKNYTSRLTSPKGFYFTKSNDKAKIFAQKRGFVKPYFIKIINYPTNKDKIVLEYSNIDDYLFDYGKTISRFGYDGAIDMQGDYIVWESTQIKLADGSNTTFDVNNPDIRYGQGGEIEENIREIAEVLWSKLDFKKKKQKVTYKKHSIERIKQEDYVDYWFDNERNDYFFSNILNAYSKEEKINHIVDAFEDARAIKEERKKEMEYRKGKKKFGMYELINFVISILKENSVDYKQYTAKSGASHYIKTSRGTIRVSDHNEGQYRDYTDVILGLEYPSYYDENNLKEMILDSLHNNMFEQGGNTEFIYTIGGL